MSANKKLLHRFWSNPVPKDFTWAEMCKLLAMYGFSMSEGRGSRVRFINKNYNERLIITMHRPHPKAICKQYQIREARKKLEEGGLTNE